MKTTITKTEIGKNVFVQISFKEKNKSIGGYLIPNATDEFISKLIKLYKKTYNKKIKNKSLA